MEAAEEEAMSPALGAGQDLGPGGKDAFAPLGQGVRAAWPEKPGTFARLQCEVAQVWRRLPLWDRRLMLFVRKYFPRIFLL